MTRVPQTSGSGTNGRHRGQATETAFQNPSHNSRPTTGRVDGLCDNGARTGDLVGYARVSTADQNLELQLDALEAAGCVRVFTETASGARADRPELAKALDFLRPGDTLVTWKLDRLGRSLPDLIAAIRGLEERGIGFKSLQESLDTTSATGRLLLHLIASLAEFERALLVERTQAGLAAARARGRYGGRPVTMTAEKRHAARQLRDAGQLTVAEIAETLGVSRSSVYRALEGS